MKIGKIKNIKETKAFKDIAFGLIAIVGIGIFLGTMQFFLMMRYV